MISIVCATRESLRHPNVNAMYSRLGRSYKFLNQLHLTIGDSMGGRGPDEVEVYNTHSVVTRLYTKPGTRYLTMKSRRRGALVGYFANLGVFATSI